MKKKILIIISVFLGAISLFGCNITPEKTPTPTPTPTPTETEPTVVEKARPEFYGESEIKVNLNHGKDFNPMSGLEVWANGSDISDMVIYTIYDSNDNDKEVNSISLSFGGTYRVEYYIPETLTNKKATFTRKVIVGTGTRDFVYDENNLTYELVWSDEFNGTKLDESNWTYEIGNGSGGWGNNELQYYTNSEKNCFIEDGVLNIKAIKENKNNFKYTSTRIVTRNKADFKYGRFEARMIIPSGRGIWPAFWMMPTKSVYGGWPNSGEIDIMEHVGYDANRIYCTVHNQQGNGGNGQQKGGSKVFNTIYTEYHVYAVEWFPDAMKFYVDDTLVFTYSPSTRTQANWPYDQEFYMILNVAVGGNWGGARGVDDSIFPQTLKVDYVRVYQAKELEIYQ